MSQLTLELLRRKPPRKARKWHERVTEVTDLLVAAYGSPTLGNFRDPVKEIFYIVLSAKTTEALYKKAHKRLWARFPTLDALADARAAEIRACVAAAGLGRKRAVQLKSIASRLRADFGLQPARKLRRLSAQDAYTYLRSLPGVGPKSALCVMMYSLDFDVFPVDAHAHRVLQRLGAIKSGSKHYHAQDLLPAFVPPGRSKELHVALVIHGRVVCKSQSPQCTNCLVAQLCSTGAKRGTLPRYH